MSPQPLATAMTVLASARSSSYKRVTSPRSVPATLARRWTADPADGSQPRNSREKQVAEVAVPVAQAQRDITPTNNRVSIVDRARAAIGK